MLNAKPKILLLCLIALTAVIYLPNLNNQFLYWDDYHMVVNDPSVQSASPSNVLHILQSHLGLQYSRITPLTYITYAFDNAIYGMDPRAFHLTNTILHVFTIICVFWFVTLLTGYRFVAFLTGLLFALHPMNVEAVCWVSARSHLLFVSLYLCSASFYLLFQQSGKERRSFLFYTYFFFVLSLLSCGFAVTLPIFLLVCDYYRQKSINIQNLKSKVPLLILSLGFGILAVWAARYSLENPTPYLTHEIFSFLERLHLSLTALCLYLQKFILPISLSAMYPIRLYLHQPILTALSLGALAVTVLTWRRWPHPMKCGALFFIITILPTLHFLGGTESIISNRYLYLPGIGLCLILAFWMTDLLHHNNIFVRKASGIILILYLSSLALTTYQRIHIWQDTATLWNSVIESYPRLSAAYVARAKYYYRTGLYAKALEDLRTVEEISPDNKMIHELKGNTFLKLKKYPFAIEAYSAGISAGIKNYRLYNGRAIAFTAESRYTQAISDLTMAINLAPQEINPRLNRAEVYLIIGKRELAKKDLREVLNIDPRMAAAQTLLNELNQTP